MLPSPYGWGLGLRGSSLSGPPVRSLSLRPGDSLTSQKDCFVDGLQIFGFPPTCHPSYRASDSYPDRTDSCWTCQPYLDTHPDMTVSRHPALIVQPLVENPPASGQTDKADGGLSAPASASPSGGDLSTSCISASPISRGCD
jgi:hypothetical protein